MNVHVYRDVKKIIGGKKEVISTNKNQRISFCLTKKKFWEVENKDIKINSKSETYKETGCWFETATDHPLRSSLKKCLLN